MNNTNEITLKKRSDMLINQSHATTYSVLTHRDLSQVRKSIDSRAYQKSMKITFFWFTVDLFFYVLAMYGIFSVNSIFLKLFFGVLAGVATSSMFVWAHDAAHGALFKNKVIAEILGSIFMLPSLNMYRLWSYGHNRIHHGFTSFSPLDWIWRPLTIDEYVNLNNMRKFLYKIERSLYGCGLHYIYKVWWPKMVAFAPSNLDKSKIFIIRVEKLISLAFVLIVGFIYYRHGGVLSAIIAVGIPFIVFNYVISLIVYLHHTHPKIPFFDDRAKWNHTIGALYCTTVIYSNWLLNNITHHIMIHTPHHVDIRIPFYRLKIALKGIKEQYGQYLHEYQMNMLTLRQIFKSCKLYNYNEHIWYSFAEAKLVK